MFETIRRPLVAFFVAALTALLAACATFGADQPYERLAVAKGTYAATVSAVTDLHRAGEIPDQVLVNRIEPARLAARAALDQAEVAIDQRKGGAEISAYITTATALVNELVAIFEEYN